MFKYLLSLFVYSEKKSFVYFRFFFIVPKKTTGPEQLIRGWSLWLPKRSIFFVLCLLSIQKCRPSFRRGDSEFSDGNCITATCWNLWMVMIPSFEAASSSSSSRLGGPRWQVWCNRVIGFNQAGFSTASKDWMSRFSAMTCQDLHCLHVFLSSRMIGKGEKPGETFQILAH